MKTTITAVCLVCGKEFEKTVQNKIYCSEICRVSAQYDIKQNAPLPPDVDLKIGKIIDILQTLNITYGEYAKNIESRREYIEKYKEVQNNGIV